MIHSARDLSPELQDLIRKAKAAYGRVFLVQDESSGGEVFAIIRPLTKKEVDLLEVEHDEMRQHDDMLAKSLIYPSVSDMDDWEAGQVNMVLNGVVQVSGWNVQGLVDAMHDANEHRETMYGAMVSFVCAAFKLAPKQVDEMTSHELMRHVAAAQDILGQPFDFQRWLDPKGWEKRQKKQMRRIPGGRAMEQEVPEGMQVDTTQYAQSMADKSYHDIMADPEAVQINKSDPDAIRKMIQEQRRAMSG